MKYSIWAYFTAYFRYQHKWKFVLLTIVKSKRHNPRQIHKILISLDHCFCRGQRCWWGAGSFLPSSCGILKSLWVLVFPAIGHRLVTGCWEVFCGLWGPFWTKELFYIVVCECRSLDLYFFPVVWFRKLCFHLQRSWSQGWIVFPCWGC